MKVYRIDSGGSKWEQLGESIYGDNANDSFGWSVDISPDGNSLAVGTYLIDGPGYVKVFSLENGGGVDDDLGANSWKQIGLTITGEANGDRFGSSVSLSDDAKTLAVGAPFANDFDSGHVRVYGGMIPNRVGRRSARTLAEKPMVICQECPCRCRETVRP